MRKSQKVLLYYLIPVRSTTLRNKDSKSIQLSVENPSYFRRQTVDCACAANFFQNKCTSNLFARNFKILKAWWKDSVSESNQWKWKKNHNYYFVANLSHQALPVKSVVSGWMMKTIFFRAIRGQLSIYCIYVKLPWLGLGVGLTENKDCGFLHSRVRVVPDRCLCSARIGLGVFFW